VFITSGANVGFAVTPSNNYIIDVYGYQTAVSYVSNTIVVGNTTIGLNSITLGNTQINSNNITVGNTTIGLNSITSNGTANSYFMGSVGIGTSTPPSSLSMAGGGITIVQDGDYFGGGAYYGGSPSNWRNSVSSEGGWAIRNTGGYLTFFTGSNPGTAGSVISDMAERMRIDSSGNVGIGTNSPSSKLQIQQNQNGLSYFDFYNTNFGASYGVIYRQITSNSANTGTVSADIVKYASGLWVFNNNDTAGVTTFGTAGSERMRIDSSGRVTKPYQPAFFATGNGGTVTMSVGSYIPFNSLNTTFAGSNRNSGFNTSNYLYTAPVAGLYQFYVQLYLSPSSRNNSITWWKNGAQMSYGSDVAQAIYISTNSSTAPDTVVFSGAVIMELAAGDYVGLQVRTTFGNVTMYMGHSTFWGYLVA